MDKFDQYQIDNYLLGNLTGDELASFEKQLKNNPSLQKSVDEQKLLISAVDTLGDLRMKERVRQVHKRATKEDATIRGINMRTMAIAATVLLAIGLSLWIWLRPPLHERLYADFYEPYPISFGSRSTETGQQLVEASRLYKNGEFDKAASLFEKYIGDNPDDDKLLLAAGISFMEINDNDKALRYFESIIVLKDSPFMEQALWYSALIFLKDGDIEKCKNYLDTLAADEYGYYFRQASTLLSGLDK